MSELDFMPRLNVLTMSGPGTVTPQRQNVELPEIEEQELTTKGEGWIVTVFDHDSISYEQVMFILMRATCCTSEEAYIESWEIDHYGKCIVHSASESECNKAATIISTIGIKVEATPAEQ